jgi:steroid delta-isomerase-like uncharacterized protein
MGTDENKAVAPRSIEGIWNKGDLGVVQELLASGYVHHVAGAETVQSSEGMGQFVTAFRSAFPDLTFTIEDQIAEEDKVLTCWTGRGTHQGELQGIAPTGKQITITGMTLERIVNGKVMEGWAEFDALGMMQQLGVIPVPEQATS